MDAERQFVGRISQVEFSIFILGGLLRNAWSGLVSRLLFSQLRRHFEAYEELLRIPQGLIKSWFDFEIPCLLSKLDVEPSTALLAIALFLRGWDVLVSHDWFPYSYGVVVIINTQRSTKMSQRLPDGSEERVGGGGVEEVDVDAFVRRKMTLAFAKAVLKRFYQKENYFSTPSLHAQESVSDGVSPIRSGGEVPYTGAADDTAGAVSDVDEDWASKGAADVYAVNKRALMLRLQQQQELCRAKKRRVLTNMLEVFKLAIKLVEDPVASAPETMERDAANAIVTMAIALKRTREEPDEAKVELAKITKA